ncbi:MAG: response regulator [Chloroflexi bacterium]|nr:response regulator [Chloroflexota bacterium]
MDSPVKILVVEDDPSLRTLLSVALRRKGYDVTLANDGASARSLLTAHPVDVMLTNMRPPLMEREPEPEPGQQALPLSVRTTIMSCDLERLPFALLDRASGLLAKPFDLSCLYLTIERCLTR